MKKIILLVLVLSLVTAVLAQEAKEQSAQTLLVPHFTESSKKIILPDDYNYVYPEIREGMITVSSSSILYFDLDGNCIYGTNFPLYRIGDTAPYFSKGAALLQRPDGDYGRKTMMLFADGTYRDMPTGTKAKSGMSNDLTRISTFIDGVAVGQRGSFMSSSQVFIDQNFKDIYPALKSDVKSTFGDLTTYPVSDGLRVFYNAQTGKYGYADAKGKIVVTAKFDKARNFSEGLAAVQITSSNVKKWGFIDKTGKMAIEATYNIEPGRFTEGLAPVRIGQSESSFAMNYIDKTGKRLMPESVQWNLNEFHNGFAWVGTGCDKLFVMNREFAETRDMTADFYHNGNGVGVCSFDMKTGDVQDKVWGIDFPNGRQALNQGGVAAGDIFAPDGTLLFSARSADGSRVLLNQPTEGDLMLVSVRIQGEKARIGSDDKTIDCFINTAGEIVYYFVNGFEGFEGSQKPVARK